MNAAPSPWTTRAKISTAGVGASAEPSEAATNTMMPPAKTLRMPKRSPAAPPSSSTEDNSSR